MCTPTQKIQSKETKEQQGLPSQEVPFSLGVDGCPFKACIEDDAGESRLSVNRDMGDMPHSTENRTVRGSALMMLSAAGKRSSFHLIQTDLQKCGCSHRNLRTTQQPQSNLECRGLFSGKAVAVPDDDGYLPCRQIV